MESDVFYNPFHFGSKSSSLSKEFANIVFILPFSFRPDDKEANRRNGELNISFEATKTIEEEG
jgi:hypothetical protein